MRRGFTLVELLIGITLLSVLSALVVPVVLSQIGAHSALRVAVDLKDIATGIRTFNVNVRGQPLYLEQLVNPIATEDSLVHLDTYQASHVRRWQGPYIDVQLADTLRIHTARNTGFDGIIQNDLVCYDPESQFPVTCARGAWIAVRVDSIRGAEFDMINDIVDGEAEPDVPGAAGSREIGRLRFVEGLGISYDLTIGIMYYMAEPYTGPDP